MKQQMLTPLDDDMASPDNTVPEAFPCWPCLRRKLKKINEKIWSGFGTDSPLLLESCCKWDRASSPKCNYCGIRRLVCCRYETLTSYAKRLASSSRWLTTGSVPGLLEGNVKDVLQTLAYADMIARVRVTSPLEFTNFEADMHLLPAATRQDLIAVATMVASVFADIVDAHKEHQELEYEDLVQQRRADAVSAFQKVSFPTFMTDAQGYTNNACQEGSGHFLHLNILARQFHCEVSDMLEVADVKDDLEKVIMENIPIQWVQMLELDPLTSVKREPVTKGMILEF
ncbi:hypothetical protein ACJZ2D_013620 [Fusarium nematophilum]